MIVNIFHNCQIQGVSNWIDNPESEQEFHFNPISSESDEDDFEDADASDDDPDESSSEAACGEVSPTSKYGLSPMTEAIRHAHQQLDQVRKTMANAALPGPRVSFAAPSPKQILANELGTAFPLSRDTATDLLQRLAETGDGGRDLVRRAASEAVQRRQIETLESKVNRFRDVIGEQDGQIDALTEDRDQLQQQLETAETRLATQSDNIAHLVEQRNHLKKQRNHYQELLELLLTSRVAVVTVRQQPQD
ncbi:hypothetical protein KOR42_45090 [Thalassoglobus neptunius]|uniref:Uncharacterized protein n=1 Tax=Thalassoglobus neptunius TaxID=1938619 RepID=A0A5C5VZ53_9PLAN|nr:hypothetical protein [Thalassoglobus neptunius]TWT43049.1 hypothetical protein KOR42_45090 [Thalassoglobus neptunius]